MLCYDWAIPLPENDVVKQSEGCRFIGWGRVVSQNQNVLLTIF